MKSDMYHSWLGFIAVMLLVACLSIACHNPETSITKIVNSPRSAINVLKPTSSRQLNQAINDAQLVDISSLNQNILFDIRYATENNFMKRKVYPVAKCLLRFYAIKNLLEVQADLNSQGLGLKVYDCYRPLSVQKQMWAILPDSRYVANPKTGSRHNRASAVDLTLVDNSGKELEMPTAFDDFTEKAHLNYNLASVEAKQNRQLLQEIMHKHGFVGLATEWWHFDAVDWQRFPVMDVPLTNKQ